ncbi:MAG: rhomboid family intramembrane serine protease [Chloroflexi bacterium]|nr:rhomboid family intramembrane serine protease [Chloroflexota bacterium]
MIPLSDRPPPQPRFPIVTLALLATNVAVFLFEVAVGPEARAAIIETYGMTPGEVTGSGGAGDGPLVWVTFVTSMFLHGGLLHILGNMVFLWVFGDNVESALGHLRYLLLYFLSGWGAAIIHVLTAPGSAVPSVGASGAIAGVLAAYLLYFPQAQIRTLIVLIPFITITRLSALFLIGFWFVIQVFSGLAELGAGEAGGIAYWAHVGGFLTGLGLAAVLRREEPTVPAR